MQCTFVHTYFPTWIHAGYVTWNASSVHETIQARSAAKSVLLQVHPLFQIFSYKEPASSKHQSLNSSIVFFNNCSPSTTLHVTRPEFLPSCHSSLCPLQYVCNPEASTSQLRSEWYRVKCTQFFFILGHSSYINVAQVAMWNLQKRFHILPSNWMVDTNTTLSVTTGNEVSTLLFGCEYHIWLPGGFKYSWITAVLWWHSQRCPQMTQLPSFPYSKNKQTKTPPSLFVLTTQM